MGLNPGLDSGASGALTTLFGTAHLDELLTSADQGLEQLTVLAGSPAAA
jgi:hypothetical protein